MTKQARIRLRERFFREIGPNAATFKAMFDAAPLLCFYMKDLEGHIMALNRRNCDVCNIKSEDDVIGCSSLELFPPQYAEDYLALDREVIETGKAVIGRVTQYPADRSMSFMISDVYPLRNASGKIVGTARAYRLSSDMGGEDLRYQQMRSVSTFVEKHFAEGLTLQSLIDLTGMSKNKFIRTFTETFSMTPWHYLTTVRLNAARKLLATTDKLIADIAAETGFFDQSHFTRIFRKERGMTPGEYRRRYRRYR